MIAKTSASSSATRWAACLRSAGRARLAHRLRSRTFDRGFWATMLAMHGYGMAVGAITGSLTFSSLLGLLLANAFFVLKLADVQWCRFQWNTRTIVVGIVALGLIHSEILPYTVDTELFAIPKPLLVVVFTGCSLPVEKHARRRTTSSRAVAMLQAPSAHFIVYWLGALYTTIHARLRRRFRVTTIGWHDPPAILAV